MSDPTPDRFRYAGWWLRFQIIVLGLTLGGGARWIKQAWEYRSAAPAEKTESTVDSSPAPQPAPQKTEERQ